jgi:hypothetical protein
MLIVACSAHSSGSVTTGGPVSASPHTLSSPAPTAPLMSVSVGQGKVGTQVLLTVTGCPSHDGKPDHITWQGAASPGATPASRELPGIQRDGDELHVSFTVAPDDAVGQGIFDAACGSNAVHASASFTVLGP